MKTLFKITLAAAALIAFALLALCSPLLAVALFRAPQRWTRSSSPLASRDRSTPAAGSTPRRALMPPPR